jgi:hypothetical protein
VSDAVFCADCKHRIAYPITTFLCRSAMHKCGALPKNDDARSEYLVLGRSGNVEFYYCTTARASYGKCGPEAKLFEPKVAI